MLRIAVVLAERVARGAAWVRWLRLISDVLTLPSIRRAVDVSMGGTLLLRVAVISQAPPLDIDSGSPQFAQIRETNDGQANPAAGWYAPPYSNPRGIRAYAPAVAQEEVAPDLQPGDLLYTVQPGDSLGKPADRFYGDSNGRRPIPRSQPGSTTTTSRDVARRADDLRGLPAADSP